VVGGGGGGWGGLVGSARERERERERERGLSDTVLNSDKTSLLIKLN